MSTPDVSAEAARDALFHLRPVFRMRSQPRSGLIEIAPWVDVVLLLVLVFIAHTAVIRKPGIKISMPAALATAAVPYDARVLTALRDGTFFFADQRMDQGQLADFLREGAEQDRSATLLIEADDELSHQAVMNIYNLAVESGWATIVLATRADSAPGRVSP